MLPAIRGLLIWGLLSCGPDARQEEWTGSARARDTRQGAQGLVTLSNEHSAGSFQVGRATLASAPPILRVSITNVVNPERTSVRVAVYLARAELGRPESRKIPIGNFTLYPAERPGTFLLPSSTAFRELQTEGPLTASSDVRLVLELERIRATKPWTHVELTIAPPEWRRELR
jgi:hypothetical protein